MMITQLCRLRLPESAEEAGMLHAACKALARDYDTFVVSPPSSAVWKLGDPFPEDQQVHYRVSPSPVAYWGEAPVFAVKVGPKTVMTFSSSPMMILECSAV